MGASLKCQSMFKNYCTIAIRHFKKHKLFFAINVLCLSIGITFSLIIGLYILQQENVNKNLPNIDRQYFLKCDWKVKNMPDTKTISPLAKALKEEYPQLVQNYFRYDPVTNVVSAGGKHFKEDIAICDTTLVSMYRFPLAYGKRENAFKNNNSAVITETFAMKLFATDNAIGKRLSIQSKVPGKSEDYIVSAVIKDIPYNTVTGLLNEKYSVYVPTTGNNYFKMGDPSLSWDNLNELSFITLKPEVTSSMLTVPINRLLHKYSSDFIWKNLSIYPTAVKDYYLNDNNSAIKKMVFILSLIAAFILLMVIINFININIGTSSYRLKEIGLRKTFGGAKINIVLQFLTEALLLSLIAAFISVILYQLLLPLFSQMLNTSLPSVVQFNLIQYTWLLSLAILVGLLAGVYPAFVLSASDVIQTLKGKLNDSKGALTLKRALVVVQFSLAIFVFIFALNLSKQVNYIFNKDLGYDKDEMLLITGFPSTGVLRMENFKQDLLQLPFVKSASLTSVVPDDEPQGRIILYPPKESSATAQLSLPVSSADKDYAKTFGIKMISGSFFDSSTDGIVLNETAINQLGLTPENAIGSQIQTPIANAPVTIVGVMKDYNFSSLQNKIGPIGFTHLRNNYRMLAVKLNNSNMASAVDEIKAQWKSFMPNLPFDYSFMDEKFAALYKAQLQLRTAANTATILNIVIVLLGLLGMVAFMLVKREKEIVVRKVLGADKGNILFLFLKEYAVLIIISNLIAWPLAYFATEKWLQNFAYRMHQNIVPYLFVFLFVSTIAFGLIILQCFKVAVTNPAKSLRME